MSASTPGISSGSPIESVPNNTYYPEQQGTAMAMPAPAYLPGVEARASRNTMAAVIVFIVLLVGGWSALNYLKSMSETLANINQGNTEIIAKLEVSKKGLVAIEKKTSSVKVMVKDSQDLATLMSGLDASMGDMIAGVGSIGSEMQQLNTSLDTLNTEIGAVGEANSSISGKLEAINTGLKESATQVGTMRTDIDGTSNLLKNVPPKIDATNKRLGHVNSVVSYMGTNGVKSPLSIAVTFLGIPNGSAIINATMVPEGAWK